MKHYSLIAYTLLLAFIVGCTKITTTSIGNGLIPPIDGVLTKDTNLAIRSKNFLDSIPRIYKADDHIVGFVNDPVFGKTEAKINIEVKPVSYPFSFAASKDSITAIDSVVLILSYKGVWGDTMRNVGLRVHEISTADTLRIDSLYKTDRDFATVGELTTSPVQVDVKKLKDSIKVFQDSGVNMIRIKLSSSFAERLKNYDTLTAYKNDSTFRSYFGGFQISADQTGNALLKIGLMDDNTKLAIYYRYKASGKLDTAVSYFRTSLKSGASNYIKRDRNAPAEIAVTLASTSIEDSLLYLQTQPGVSAKIKIPDLTLLPNMLIHRAELLMEQVPYTNDLSDNYFTPPLLMIAVDTSFKADSVTRFAIPNSLDFSSGVSSNLLSFGSYPITKRDNSGNLTYLYNFDITRYVQGIVTRKETSYNNLVLYAPYNEYIFPSVGSTTQLPLTSGAFNTAGVGRIRLGGGNNSLHRLRLHIIYSLL